MTATTPTNRQTLSRKNWNFGRFDSKGREIGCFVLLQSVDFVPSAEQGCGYLIAPGSYFEATVQATRSGSQYGAIK